MLRRDFLKAITAGISVALLPSRIFAALNNSSGQYSNLLILVELKGGNDGMNTVIPFTNSAYYQLRPKIAIARDTVLQLSQSIGLNPALQALMPIWHAKELAVLQGVGYPDASLSHFRSIEIWDTASKANEYLEDGWLGRTFEKMPPPQDFAADGVVMGSPEIGPMLGSTARTIVMADEAQFKRQAKLASHADQAGNKAMQHVLRIENDILQAASKLGGDVILKTEFPIHAFGKVCKNACQLAAQTSPVAAIRLTLTGFDTHQNQVGAQTNLLKQLAEGLSALRAGLIETNRWNSTLIMTYAEFGRRAKENQSGGTDHGTANMHFALGGKVRGGLLGEYPNLNSLDGVGNVRHTVDFRSAYASVLQQWWGADSLAVLGGNFKPLELIKA
jgi:uncharacterized protein (DUF1501 family)